MQTVVARGHKGTKQLDGSRNGKAQARSFIKENQWYLVTKWKEKTIRTLSQPGFQPGRIREGC